VEVKVDTADGTIVFLEAINDGTNSIIPPDIMMMRVATAAVRNGRAGVECRVSARRK
jgi:hypothetical protein